MRRFAAYLRVWQRSDRFAGSERFTGPDRITGSHRRRAGAKIPPGFFQP
jgi:hypothetical protein